MKKMFLMKNPDLFQGESYLNNSKNYFEGWYFKTVNLDNGISFIPGINIDNNSKKAFVQVISNTSSYFVDYDISDFKYNFNPFYVKVGNNFFSKDGFKIDIKDDSQNLNIHGEIKYSNNKNISTSFFNPNIMGPFSYIPFMECNHAILSMQSTAYGSIFFNKSIFDFNNGQGYIEKDWGSSFQKSYIWCQGNCFSNSNASFLLSIADIPFKLFNFRGIICVLKFNDKEYKFTTYNNAKLTKYEVNDNKIDINLKKGAFYLDIQSESLQGNRLSAPYKGKMEKDIFESISSSINICLKQDNKIIFTDTSTNCGLEIVQ